MNIGALLEPLVVASMKAKNYSREQAVEKSWLWLAGELRIPVEGLKSLDYEGEWTAHAIVERQMVLMKPTKAKKPKKRYEPPQLIPQDALLPEGRWKVIEAELRRDWGPKFYGMFFGELCEEIKVDGLLAEGQYQLDSIKLVNKMSLFDAG